MIINKLYYAPRSYCLGLLISGLLSNMNIWKSYTFEPCIISFSPFIHFLCKQQQSQGKLHILWGLKDGSKCISIHDTNFNLENEAPVKKYFWLWHSDLFNAYKNPSSGGICSFLSTKRCLKSCFNVSIILPACLHHRKPRVWEWFDKCGDTFKTWVLIICTEMRVAKLSSYNSYASAQTSIWTCVQASAFRTASQTCLLLSLLWSM